MILCLDFSILIFCTILSNQTPSIFLFFYFIFYFYFLFFWAISYPLPDHVGYILIYRGQEIDWHTCGLQRLVRFSPHGG